MVRRSSTGNPSVEEPAMRYAATHKEETREKLIESSRALAKKGGFETTGVDAADSAWGAA